MENKIKVLIINDDNQFAKTCEEKLRPYAEVYACSLNHLRRDPALIFKNKSYTHVIIDGNEYLIKTIRRFFNGPLIANSNNNKLNNAMLKAGCSHKIKKDKTFNALINILEFEHQATPGKRRTKEIKMDFVDLMLEFLASVKKPEKSEEAKELFIKIMEIIEQRKNDAAIVQMKEIQLLMTKLESQPKDTAILLEVYNKMISICSLI